MFSTSMILSIVHIKLQTWAFVPFVRDHIPVNPLVACSQCFQCAAGTVKSHHSYIKVVGFFRYWYIDTYSWLFREVTSFSSSLFFFLKQLLHIPVYTHCQKRPYEYNWNTTTYKSLGAMHQWFLGEQKQNHFVSFCVCKKNKKLCFSSVSV